MNKQKKSRPNIILINVESMDGRKMGCMGNKAMKKATPNLDRLAEEGMLFTNAYSNFPVCNPSRASMWSGKYPHYYNCWNNHEGLTDDIPTFRDRLNDAGYLTDAIGPLDYQYGMHSIRDRVGSWTRSANIHRPLSTTPMPRVIDDNQDLYRADWNRVYRAINWLEEVKDEDSPFMLYLTTGLVHPAFNVQKKFLEMIDEEKIKIPPQIREEHPVLQYQQITKNAAQDTPEELIREIRKIYFAMIATLDNMLGEFFTAIENMGLKENTYIIFTGDHGEMAMEHGQILKRTMYEPSIHVPMIISGPGVQRGEKEESLVSLIDIFPTLMDMARIEHPEGLEGESLMSLMTGNGERKMDWVFSEYHGDRCNTGTFMIRKGKWKYIHYAGYSPLLFDQGEDPWEIDNLADKEIQIVKEMKEILYDNFDPDEIDQRAKNYDKDNFKKWREQELKTGTYRERMAEIYSGYERVPIGNIMSWTDQDEQQIKDWLGED